MTYLHAFMVFNIAYVIRLLVSFTFLFLFYHRVKDTFAYRLLKYPLKTIGFIFVLFDWVYNYVMTIYMLDPPAKWDELVTGRLTRYLRTKPKASFKFKFAYFFCKWLSKADPNHCGECGV